MQGGGFAETETRIYDLSNDPNQLVPLRDENIESYFNSLISKQLKEHEAPLEFFSIFGLDEFR